MKTFDVVVIGAGVVGGLIARELSQYALSVGILEGASDVAMGATKANSGIVHAGFDAEEGTLKACFNVEGSRRMPALAEQLGVKYKNNGSLVVGFDEQDRAHLQRLVARGVHNGVEGVCLIERERLRALEPHIAEEAICALYAPTGGIVCPYELCIAAIGNAMDNGVQLLLDFAVTRIDASTQGYVLHTKDDAVQARFVVNAAGVHADEIARMIGDDSFSIRPRKGEYILLDKSCGELVQHTIFRTPSAMGKGILVSPTVDGNLLLGPTSVNIGDKDNTSTDADGLQTIIDKSNQNLNIPLPIAKAITSFCGLRAVGSLGDFIIREGAARFVHVAAIESPGLTSAPAIAPYVVQLLGTCGLPLVPKPDFNPRRAPAHAFREATEQEKNAYIRADRRYGKIVCRCEGITEGEIVAALHTNPPARDLDGVKRRTRAGMGRCQGGFCAPYVMELIARERGVDMKDVTKCGGASTIVCGHTKGDLG